MFILKNVYIEEALNLSDILIEGDRIKSIIPAGSISTNIPSFDGHGNVAFPSFVDSHVHLDKAFLIEKKEYQDNFIEKVRVTKSLKKFFPDLPLGQLVIYAGDINQDRTDVKIITINRFSKILETIDP